MTLASIYFSPFVNESRAFRQAASLIDAAIVPAATFVGYAEGGLPATDTPIASGRTIRIPVPELKALPRLPRRSLQWAVWSLRAARAVRELNPSVVQCHSLAALPASVLAARRLGKPLVYDAHELESERTGWGTLQKRFARMLEKTFIGSADQTVVVSESIARWYRDAYPGKPITVIRNLPRKPAAAVGKTRLLREALGIPADDLIFLYLGAVGEGRGIDVLLDVFAAAPATHHLVVMGSGPLADVVKAKALEFPNIHWKSPVPPDQVVAWAASADVGLSLIEDTCLSYRYCLPNKLFECRLAGLPVIASDLDEMRLFIQRHGGGWLIQPDPADLRDLLHRLDRPAIASEAQRVHAHQPTWTDEEPVLVDVFQQACRAKTRN